MLPIIQDTNEVTMTSLDFLDGIINPSRIANGEVEVRNNVFFHRIVDELDLDPSTCKDIVCTSSLRGRSYKAKGFDLNQDQMMLVGMRESKAVRKSVLAKLKELSAPKQDPIVLLAQKVLQQDAEIKKLEQTKAQINDKRTATIMGRLGNATKTIKKLEDKLQDVGTYQSLTASKIPARVDTEMKNNVQSWRLLKQLSSDMQLPPKKVKCERYGEVLAYHVDVIELFKSKYL